MRHTTCRCDMSTCDSDGRFTILSQDQCNLWKTHMIKPDLSPIYTIKKSLRHATRQGRDKGKPLSRLSQAVATCRRELIARVEQSKLVQLLRQRCCDNVLFLCYFYNSFIFSMEKITRLRASRRESWYCTDEEDGTSHVVIAS